MTVQHAQIPQILTEKKLKSKYDVNFIPILKPGDKVVYGVIRLHMDETRTCYPSIATIKRYAHCGQKFVEEAIQRLVKAGFIELGKIKLANGKWANLYRFPITEFDKTFEMFTIDFLKQNIPIHLKEYLMDMQSSMFEKETGIGKVSHSNLAISDKTGWSMSEIKKFDDTLMDLGWLSVIPSGKIDQAGIPIMIKEFNLDAIKQAKLWIKAVNEQLTTTQNQIDEVDDRLSVYEKKTDAQIKVLQKEINSLLKKTERYEKLITANGIDITKNEYEM